MISSSTIKITLSPSFTESLSSSISSGITALKYLFLGFSVSISSVATISNGGIVSISAFLTADPKTGTHNVKVLPSFSLLCKMISPLSNLANSRLIDSPKPVPPYLRLVEPSACWKASKIKGCLPNGIPIPVSFTIKQIILSSSVFTLISKLTDPLSVNLIAFEIRFLRICSKRILSVLMTIGASLAMISNLMFFSFATWLNRFQRFSVISFVETSKNSRSIFPASIFDKSRISSIKPNKLFPEL
ncbi:hypothetical protein D3C85_565600 [compost metagenome]